MKRRNHSVSVQKDNSQMQSRMAIAQYTAGPLPPSAELREYENMYPGITKELMETYRKQVEHRISVEDKAVDSAVRDSSRGQVFAFLLGLIVILGGFAAVFMDKEIFGIGAIVTAFASLAYVFVRGKKKD